VACSRSEGAFAAFQSSSLLSEFLCDMVSFEGARALDLRDEIVMLNA